MSLDKRSTTPTQSGSEVIMSNQDEFEARQIQLEAAKNRLNDAIYKLEQLGIDVDVVDQYLSENRSTYYSGALWDALSAYFKVKSELSDFYD
jgi:hypothetical protein